MKIFRIIDACILSLYVHMYVGAFSHAVGCGLDAKMKATALILNDIL